MDRQDFEKNILLKARDDGHNGHRGEYNGMLELRVAETSGVVRDKYLTVTTTRKNPDDARAYFARAKTSLSKHFEALGSRLHELTAAERLKIFHDFFNAGEETQFRYEAKECRRFGYSFKEAVCPPYAEIQRNYFRLGDRWGRVLFLRDFAAYLSDEFISQLSSQNRNMMLSIDIVPEYKVEAIRLAESRVLAVTKNSIEYLRKAQNRKDYTLQLPFQMTQQQSDAQEFLNDLGDGNQNMFYATVSLAITSETKEQLEADTEALLTIAQEHLCRLATLGLQQQDGLNTVLPWGMLPITADRTLTTESLMVLTPWTVQDIVHRGGIYYGQNAISGNMILIDDTLLSNGNGFIFGKPGVGKSFLSKEQIIARILATGADVIIVDPEREYARLVRALGGEVVTVSTTSDVHINAMDMSRDYGDNIRDAVSKKVEFLLSLCEQLIGGAREVGAKERSLIDRACGVVYRDYIASDFTKAPPTLKDFHTVLVSFPEPEARELALKLETYTVGNLDIFSYQTNLDVDSRLLCYDIHDLGSSLMSHGLLVILDGILNRVSRNRQAGRRTYIYIDEVYLLFKHEYSARFLSELWKRVRKYNAAAIGITQNVGDILQSHYAETMFSNSELLTLLGQAPLDLVKLAEILGISDAQAAYLENPEPGSGLLKVGSVFIPFTNNFPKDTELYRLMSTRPNEKSDRAAV